MNKTFTLIFILFGLNMMVNAQSTTIIAPPATNTTANITAAAISPDLLILKEKEFNFGKIPQGKPVTHVFEIENKSNDSLKIINVQASCGCTTPEWEKNKVVLPGGNTKITIGYNAAAEGAFSKLVTITYNGNQTKQITITGEVWKTPVTSAPENKNINDLKN